MQLLDLNLTNFKNIEQAALRFSPEINCFLGNNGMGKSNLLDAIYMLSFTKSFTGAPDSLVITSGEEFTTARAHYSRHSNPAPEELTLGITRGRRKSLKLAGKEYQRLSQHIGRFPLVLIAPHDIDLVRGTAEERRRWMDMVISQTNPSYLDALIRYNGALEQRNKLLRDGATDRNLFLAIESVLDLNASVIHRTRTQWVDTLASMAQRHYNNIAGNDAESLSLEFISSLNNSDESLMQLLDYARRHDEIVRHTSVGPHRDDINLSLNGLPARRTGSQGQLKTLTIALRLAQYEFIAQISGLKPLLLLDDIFDKLDASRVERIMQQVTSPLFGQIFITDTNRKHLDDIILKTYGKNAVWNVENGSFTPIT